jgi:hypothetical protein
VSALSSPAAKTPNNKPRSLLITSALILLSVVIQTATLIWHWHLFGHPVLALIFGLSLGAGLLWFYWDGHPWARYFVLLTSSFGVCDALYSLTGFRGLRFVGSVAQGELYINVSRLCVSIYFIAWLLTPEASKYFNANARTERKSHTAYLKYQRRVRTA